MVSKITSIIEGMSTIYENGGKRRRDLEKGYAIWMQLQDCLPMTKDRLLQLGWKNGQSYWKLNI